ncbi:phage baseplate assembly protein [Komagataeibacter sp. FNDCR2]|uniref:phage baseplate assembly protein n=1 Tax=Komagataeibacter sp. FNDCR2 TaxID=2878682 RepID=UPI001E62C53C|nr:phage tail protein [Komagataeibacter sp. FNDCR2]MCE2576022.1 phage tail protein [Komagataeibacter sp. FNDCR2]
MSILNALAGGDLPDINTEVTLTIGNTKWSGWQEIRVTRGAERCPADYDISLTEKYLDASQIDIQPGQPCKLSIGDVKVIDGYVDMYGIDVGEGHQVRIAGRSRCSDLVDTHAVVQNSQLGNCDIVALASKLCAPYGIDVVTKNITLPATVYDRVLPLFNITLGETPYQIIEECARYMAVMVYDDADGNLVLSSVGTDTHASGFAEGVNVLEYGVTYRMDERFSTYLPVMFSVQNFNDFDNPNAGNRFTPVTDPGVPRYRPYFVISEQNYNGQSLAQLRAQWELQRRRGRSQAVRLVCDSWHDKAGVLWTPNTLVPVHLPALKLPGKTWLIVDVTFSKNAEMGTTAELTLMPPESMTVEPAFQNSFDWQLQNALQNADGQEQT